jgi:hypothetical protein
VKLAHAAYQSCTKAWDGIRGPSDGKRAMWQALTAARKGLVATMKAEARAFGVMETIVGQGDLFNGEQPEGGSGSGGDDEGPHDPAGDPPAEGGSTSSAIVVRGPRRRTGRGQNFGPAGVH